ncbi:MAG: hypothetical protein KDA24_05915 [Deltaproteobacteria bacterium]|nr:hypothetical protein [Deltaproteobacteria bacterium]
MDTTASPPAALPHLPDNASWPRRVLVGFQTLMVLKEDAGNPAAGALINRAFDYEVYEAHIQRMRATPQGARLLSDRPSLERNDLDLGALSDLPEGSLGRALVDYFDSNGFPPFHTDQPLDDDHDYISKRYRETHDCYHVVTGYKTDDLSEMELQAFVMGNLGIRSPWVILTFGYPVVGLLQHKMLPFRYLSIARTAWKRGQAARPFLEFPFEDHWATPLSEVRRILLGDAAT